ncbi:MAG TPA: DegQ family serine endoprotease [Steroidobacteraceae bacterium]|nr:DegQ family serine endoprotease [Steroidobacteraceae bacterium]
MKTSPAVLLAALAAVLTACSNGEGADQPALANESANQAASQPSAGAQAAMPTRATGSALPDFAPLVEQYGAAVVNVEVVQQVRQARGPGGDSDDPLLDFFRRFGLPAPQGGQGGPGESMPARGSGSGFIVSADGYILTNSHVVAEADDVTVRLTDRREFQAKVIGSDAHTDIALIKIDAKDLPTVRIGDPRRLRPGEWVLAIGSPFGLDNSATAGIVSATSRAVGGGESYVPFIQTDVAVNPGNSGGPLFNLRGEVIGVNSMIFSRTGGYMGLSFAIPIDVANDVREQLLKTGKVVRGRIGVGVQDVNAQLAESFGLDRPHGALVSAIEDDSPAAKAGIKPGDVVLAVNGQDVDRVGDLRTRISELKPGTKADLRVWRDGKERTLQVNVAELEEQQTPRTAARQGASDETARLGLAVRPLTPDEKNQVETEGNLVVEQVSGPAALAGVQPGDIILGVNGKRVASVQELRGAVKQKQATVALLIERGDAQIFIPLRVG